MGEPSWTEHDIPCPHKGKGKEKATKMAETTAGPTPKPRTPKPPKTTAMADVGGAKAPGTSHKAEAKAKFSKALDEAKAGAAALKAEAVDRAGSYGKKARGKSDDWMEEAKAYGNQAKGKATDLATDGKAKASDAISSLSKLASENAHTLDEKLGQKYGDYARSASRSLQDTAARLDAKTVEEIGEDAREMVRKSPAMAVGIAAFAGFMLSRMFRGSSD